MDRDKHDNRCLHEMLIGQCAICAGLQTPDEEQEELDKGIIRLVERLGKN